MSGAAAAAAATEPPAARAAARALRPGEPLRLDDAPGAWLVLNGEAQVFAAARDAAGAPEGPRWGFGAVGPGGLLLGAALGPGAPGEALLATGRAGTELLPVDLDRLGPDAAPRLARAAEGWAALLAEGFGRALGPRPRLDAVLAPGEPASVAPGAAAGAMRDGVWAEVTGGSAALYGMVSVSGRVPLPVRAWLAPEGAPRIAALTGREAVARPGWAAELRAATAACLEAMPLLRGMAEADELNRLRLRRELDAEADADSRSGMARLLGNPPPRRPPRAETGADDGLYGVMARVARASGLALRRPVRVREADLERPPDAAEYARASDLRLRRVRLPRRWWAQDLGPLLGRERGGARRPVALLPGGGGYRAVDADGRERALTPALAEGMDATAWALVGPLPDAGVGLWRLVRFGLHGTSAELGVLLAAALLGAALGQVVPLAVGLAFSTLIPAGLSGALAGLALALAAVALVGFGVQVAQEVARQRVEARAGWAGQAALWDRVLRLPLAQLHRFPVGELLARTGAAANLSAGVRGLALVAAGALAMLLSTAATMLWHHPAAALVALAFTAVQLLAAALAGWRQERAFGNGGTLAGLADALAFQITTGIAKLRVAGAEARAFRRWADRSAAMRARSVEARGIAYAHEAWQATAGTLALAGLYATIALLDGPEAAGPARAPLSDVVAFLAAARLHMGASGVLGDAALGAWMQAPAWRSARPVLAAAPEPASGRADPGRLSGAIEVANLRFAYPGAEAPVLRGVSARIGPGEFVAVTGRSGSGKTTLLRLLLGLERPGGGSVAYDGQELHLLDLTAVRRQVATVLQNGRLPPGSILDAVRGLGEADEAQVWEALRAAAVADDVAAMPMGLRTMLTDATRTLSGGQVQRLLIARAILQRPAVLLLDEATSALDTATEAAVSRALDGLPATRIVVAHRLGTIRRADRILHLEDGRVAESGTYAELAARGGGFARLVAAG